MLRTTLALKAWAVYRIAKTVNLFVITARLASLRKSVLAKEDIHIMLEKICWFILHGIRGGIYAVPFMGLFAFLVSGIIQPSIGTSSFAIISAYVSNGITLLGWGVFVTGLVVWIDTWISDYRSDYLPNWIRKDLY